MDAHTPETVSGTSASPQKVMFYVPSSSSEPIEIDVEFSGLKMVLVNRESIGWLGEKWKVRGIYFLLGVSPTGPYHFRAYVGEVAGRDFLTRLKEHTAKKPWWNRALLISHNEFNSAHIGWLEGRFYGVLNHAPAADLDNEKRPVDDSLQPKDLAGLEGFVEKIKAALRACGASPDTADQKPMPKGKKPKHYSETLADLIAEGLLKPETKLQPLKPGLATQATVLPDGQLQVEGQTFSSPSGAAKAVSGTVAEAGWNFWGVPSGGKDGLVSLFDLRERLRADPQEGHVAASVEAVVGADPTEVAVP